MIFKDALNKFEVTFKVEFIQVEDDGVSYTFKGDRCGDSLFTPTQEDDDNPDFNHGLVEGYFLKYRYIVEAYDHEKGYFTVQFIKEVI